MEVLGRQLAWCDVCGTVVHRKDLVRTQVRYVSFAGQNYFTYSTYNTNLWTVDTAVDAGAISVGSSNGLRCRFKVPYTESSPGTGMTLTEAYGSQTWTGAGVFRSDTATDVSDATNITVSAQAGPYQASTSPETVFAMGVCDSAGDNKSLQRTWTVKGTMRVWFTMPVASITAPLSSSSAYFYIAVTPGTGQRWWIEDLQLEKDVLKPGTFVPTSGTAVDTTESQKMTVRVVCPDCREPLQKIKTGIGRPRTEMEHPIGSDIQEP